MKKVFWCLHCERTYFEDEQQQFTCDLGSMFLCHYDDCDGSEYDRRPWQYIRKYHPEYPEVPEKGIMYSLY